MSSINVTQAAQKYGFSTSFLRRLVREKRVKFQSISVGSASSSRAVYLIDEASLRKYLKNRQKPGRPKTKK